MPTRERTDQKPATAHRLTHVMLTGALGAAAIAIAIARTASAAPDAGADAVAPVASVASVADAATGDAATTEPTARVLMLAGTQEATPSIDPRIAHVHQLAHPPLSTYNTYKLLDDKVVRLGRAPVTQVLANGTTLRLTLVHIIEPPHPGGHRRARVRVERMSGNAGRIDKIEVTVGPRENVFVGGQGHGRGALFLSLTVTIPAAFQL